MGNTLLWSFIAVLFILLVWAFYKRYRSLKDYDPSNDSDKLVILTDVNFNKTIARGVTLVDFWAEWCTPCKIQGPIVSEVAEELADKANIAKLDVQTNQKTAKQLGIRNIPTIIIFKDGKIVQQFVGVKAKSVLVKAVKEALS
ncbi:MAG: thioredoxin [Bacteroidetes bacterium]|nr:MAG: thioredoxin [Bacteroidota bacterium]